MAIKTESKANSVLADLTWEISFLSELTYWFLNTSFPGGETIVL